MQTGEILETVLTIDSNSVVEWTDDRLMETLAQIERALPAVKVQGYGKIYSQLWMEDAAAVITAEIARRGN